MTDDIEMTWADLKQPVTIYDIRTQEETIFEPAPAGMNIQWVPLEQWTTAPPALPPHTVAILCRSGKRSGALTLALREHGCDNVYSIAGGVLAYKS